MLNSYHMLPPFDSLLKFMSNFRNGSVYALKDVNTNICGSFICNSLQPATTYMSTQGEWLNKMCHAHAME